MEHKMIECDICKEEFSENQLSVSDVSAFVVCPECREEEEQEQEYLDLLSIR